MNLSPFRTARTGLAVLALLMLMLPLAAHAQAGAPANDAVQGSWTRDVNAPQWGETPQDVRVLMVKLQAVTHPGGPDAFDVVWLRELLRRPAMYHLNDADQAWMRRTIAVAEQAHLSHWQPAVAAETAPPVKPVTMPMSTATARPVLPPHAATPVSTTTVNAPNPSTGSAMQADGLSAGWAMTIAALVISLLLGLWINHCRSTTTASNA